MARLVPILEYLHELRTAGRPSSYELVVRDPSETWRRLPADRKAAFLARQGLDPQADVVQHVRVLRRRGKEENAESVYVDLELENADPDFATKMRMARDRLLFEPLVTAGARIEEEGDPADDRFVDASRGRSDALGLLDRAWGATPYDLARDGALCEPHLPKGATEIERYWVDEPFAMVVMYTDGSGRTNYHVAEPGLTPLERSLLVTLNERLRDVLNFDPDHEDRAGQLVRKLLENLKTFRFRSERRTAYKLGYYFIRNYIGFGRIDPIMRDERVEDLSCNGADLPLYLVHSKYQNVATNLRFDELELNSLTIKLAQRGGKLLSIAAPLVDATLPGGSRIQASIGREVTCRGSSFTIRKFREDPLTCIDLIRGGTHTVDTMAFLWLAVELKLNLLVMGATASGKTTSLNCISQFIPPSQKIVSIEDTREITLQHENWLASITREAFTKDQSERITMFELLRAALRQRPEYIIVGEIRGVEGQTLFQAMSTGHTCFSTMHAGSVENAVYRLENAPISVPRVMMTSLDLMLLQGQTELDGKAVRRMLSLTEVNGLDPATRNLRTNELFHWDGDSDRIVESASSTALDAARARRGWSRGRIEDELVARAAVLKKLVDANDRHYTSVARAAHTYYERHGLPPAETADDLAVEFELVPA